ncbi:MAG TPA: Spy/CpxP family protein refolding chaperone [Candidatus Omnitrophota bacterium]|nr:Spy/CpxP family protein refolding chaperone [Candidatus Omnitrophota bacterium]
MKSRKKYITAFTVLFFALLCMPAVNASAEGTEVSVKERPRMESAGKEDPFKDLSLTPEQRDKIKAHREEGKLKAKEIQEQMRAKKEELKAEMAKSVSDRSKIDAIAADMKSLSARMIDQRIERILSLKEILTPEQFQKVNAKIEEKMRKHGGKARGWGKDKGRMPPPPEEE